MGKLLRVLVVILLLLSIVSVVFGFMLFAKREELIGRTRNLERTLIKLAGTLETGDATVEVTPTYPQRDISPVTSREIQNPDLKPFWDSYDPTLEVSDTARLNYGTTAMQMQLRQYYQRDIEGKKIKNELTQKPSVEGPGTMQVLLEEVIARANDQYARLNKTRGQLTSVRAELSETIIDLNSEKSARRKNLGTIEEQLGQIAGLEGDKRRLEGTVTTLNENIEQLNTDIQDLNGQIAVKDESIVAQQGEIAKLNKRIEELINTDIDIVPGEKPVAGDWADMVAPGVKGTVVSVDEEWNFVVVKLETPFLNEILGDDLAGPMPMLDLNVKRPGLISPAGDFVTKVRLRHLKRDEGLAIADVLQDWEQSKVRKGDDIWF